MSLHAIYFPHLAAASGPITIQGEEAHHALRVKRLEIGDEVRLLDGRGTVVAARLASSRKVRGEWEVEIEILSTRRVEPAKPRLTVLSAAPKGERLDALIDGLSQAGAAAWGLLQTDRTVVEPRQGKLGRLERIAVEAMKQCGRAWMLEIGEPVAFEEALNRLGRVVIADGSGGPYQSSGESDVALLVGPEGGWSEKELTRARAKGVQAASFGPHVMRIETAAVVGAGVVMQATTRP
jgi:16S rRNA (uracil1498-N3)-methyltransferase